MIARLAATALDRIVAGTGPEAPLQSAWVPAVAEQIDRPGAVGPPALGAPERRLRAIAGHVGRRCDGDGAGDTARVIDGILGAALGGEIGRRMRRWYFARKLVKAQAGVPVRVRARAHPEGAPDWRYWRGSVQRHGRVVTFTPLVRRWRRRDLSGASPVGTALKRSAADGDRVLVRLIGVPAVDHLAVSPDAEPVLTTILS